MPARNSSSSIGPFTKIDMWLKSIQEDAASIEKDETLMDYKDRVFKSVEGLRELVQSLEKRYAESV